MCLQHRKLNETAFARKNWYKLLCLQQAVSCWSGSWSLPHPRVLVALRHLCFRQVLDDSSGIKSVMSFLHRKIIGFARGLFK